MASSLVARNADAGQPDLTPLTVSVSGMSCAGCAGRLERQLKSVPGVSDAVVNFALERATVAVDSDGPDMDAVIGAVEEAGFEAAPFSRDDTPGDRAARRAETRALFILGGAILLTLPLVGKMVLSMAGMPVSFDPWWEFALATPVQFIAGWRFYRGAWAALKHRSGTMDSLVALGTSAAYFYSLAVLLFGIGEGHLYFESAAVIVTLILMGRVLEARAKRKTGEAIRALMDLRPESALVLRDGGYKKVPLSLVRSGDTVLVRPGARVPVDGEVTEGRSEVDESMLTGESMPVARGEGDMVYTGTVNGMGGLTLKVSAVAEESRLGKIVQIVENAQAGKAPVQALVDRISAIFVPVVLVVALVTFAAWLTTGQGAEAAMTAAVSVLVIACPCALGLATPTAIVAGMGAAARSGILFRNVEALETAFNLDMVVFDKTGTLTEGHPQVIEVLAVSGDPADAVRLASAVQSGSDHPLAQAFVTYASDQGLSLPVAGDITVSAGFGLSGTVDGRSVMVGNAAMMKKQAVSLAEAPQADPGYTKAFIAVDGLLVAVALLEDIARPEAASVVAALKKRGLKTVLLSGDAEPVVAKLSDSLGLDQAYGGVLPEEKSDRVAEFRKAGQVVAMVGDGINDAPALASADVGIAMGSGTDVALETAGVTLMRPDLRLIAAVASVSKRTVWKIRQNLFWAFIFNIIGIPLAAFGLLNPMIAGGAMAFSSVLVLSNSLLLRQWKAENAQ